MKTFLLIILGLVVLFFSSISIASLRNSCPDVPSWLFYSKSGTAFCLMNQSK